MKTKVIKVLGQADIAVAAAEAADRLAEGGLVGFATETVYGIAARATSPEAMDRLRRLKDRPKTPFSVHLGRAEDVVRYVSDVPPPARRVINKFWPGPITVLLPTGGELADRALQDAGLHDALCMDNVIGLRCPSPEVSRAILSSVDDPVVATSANARGCPAPRGAGAVIDSFDGKIDLLVDSGPTDHGRGSTIVKFDGSQWSIVRVGAVPRCDVARLVRHKIVFVCTGNTCRSAMAEGIARKLLADRAGVPAEKLDQAGLAVASAGLWAVDGRPATPEAIDAARRQGADISRHRSQKLTPELIKSADILLCMTDLHLLTARRLGEGLPTAIRKFDPSGDVPDPIGAGEREYRRIAERLGKVIQGLIEKGSL